MIEILPSILILLGMIFIFIGSIGIFKFPDFFTRCHAAGVIDGLSTVLIIFGLMIHKGFNLFSLKLFLLMCFMLITIPTSTHYLAKNAYIYFKKDE